MIVFLTLTYCALLLILVKLKVLPWNTATKLSPVVVLIALLVFLFIPLQWSAPAGDVRVLRYTIEVVPNVAGPVIEVPARPSVPVKEGDVLFRIDPTVFQAKVDQIKAQLAFQETRLAQFTRLARTQAGTRFQVEQTEAQVAQLRAQLAEAEFNLAETVVRAPSDGFPVNVVLRPGQRVVTFPFRAAMSFVDTGEDLLIMQVHQIYARHIEPGLPVETTFKFFPGRTFTGTVDGLIPVNAQGQPQTGGTLPGPQSMAPGPFFVRLKLDDAEAFNTLPAGSIGQAAIYSPRLKPAHIIRKVMIRMDAWMNYIVPN